eukprot:Awhi_evm2s14675
MRGLGMSGTYNGLLKSKSLKAAALAFFAMYPDSGIRNFTADGLKDLKYKMNNGSAYILCEV